MQVERFGKEYAQTVLDQHQKFHKAREVAMELATLTSEVGMDEYHDHLALLRLLKDKWANGENVTLTCGDTGIYVCSVYTSFLILNSFFFKLHH